MALKREITACIVVVLVYNALASPEDPEVEIITKSKFVSMESGDNFTVLCHGKKPLEWTLPEVTEEEAKTWTIIITESETPVDRRYHYGSRLRIYNMTSPFEGTYYCHHKNADMEIDILIDSIHLYIIRSLKVEIMNVKEFVILYQTYNFTVFCQGKQPLKWTIPEVTGEARKWTTVISEFETPVDQMYHYGSRLTISNMTYQFQGKYYCHFINADKESETESDSIDLYVIVSPDDKEVQIITDSKNVEINLYDNFTITCQGKLPLKWTQPEVALEAKIWTTVMTESETSTSDKYHYGSWLTIYNMTDPFKGTYYCHHKNADKKNEIESDSIDLSVIELPEVKIVAEGSTIYLKRKSNFTVFCQGKKPLKWTVPEGTGKAETWTTVIIESEKPDSPRYYYGSRLTIYNMTESFSGVYYCHLINADKESRTESDRIHLHIVGLPDVEIITEEGGKINLNGNFTALCQGKTPLNWKVPYVTGEAKAWTTVITKFEIPADQRYHYGSRLTIYNVTFPFEDTYFCKLEDADWTFDQINLFVEPYVEIISTRTTFQIDLNENFTVFCQGNAPLEWKVPNVTEEAKLWTTLIIAPEIPDNLNYHYGSRLTIINMTYQFQGKYYCSNNNKFGEPKSDAIDLLVEGLPEVKILSKDKVLDINSNDNYSVSCQGKKSVRWTVPKVTGDAMFWTKIISLSEIPIDQNFQYRSRLTISNVTYPFRGTYYCHTDSHGISLNEGDKIDIYVKGKPKLRLVGDSFHLIDTPSTITCHADANPKPEFKWQFKACQTTDCAFLPIDVTGLETAGPEYYEFTSVLTFNTSESGYVKCLAKNNEGSNQIIAASYITDIKNGFDIFGIDVDKNATAQVALNETISVICGASIYNYRNITWFYNSYEYGKIPNNERYSLTKNNTKYSNMLKLEIRRANFSDSGLYRCRITEKKENYLYKDVFIDVMNPVAPKIDYTNMKPELKMIIPDKLDLICQGSGLPKPTVIWYKNEVIFNPLGSERIQISDSNENITFSRTVAEDEGTYKCEVSNKAGIVSAKQTVKFTDLPRTQLWLICVITFVSVLCITTIIFVFYRYRKERHLQRKLKKLGLANFVKGALKNINPALGVDEQAELLPYDEKYEFPIEHLKIGKLLGSGAYGVVMLAKAKNIVKEEAETTVAVKKVATNAQDLCIKALISELKIMIHLGKHLNVVNLLGACTKNVLKRELLVIVEYCRFGNLQNYLLGHRDKYIDQVDPGTDKIDYSVGQEYFSSTCSVLSDMSYIQSTSSSTCSYNSGYPVIPLRNNVGYYRADTHSGTSAKTETTTVEHAEGETLSDNSVRSEGMSTNYVGDGKANVKPICTKHLLVWAFQVARGMEYLASRKVLHGDLAARNILLADSNVVKICDFGLAKSLYKDYNYKKQGSDPLPIKWMSIESIRDRVFSTKSDVWSFGITLWEFFSLAETPYPGIEADDRLYEKLAFGYRMKSPEYAPKEIYKIMRDCWRPIPDARPSFTKLAERIGDILEDNLKEHYIQLNDPYLKLNIQRLEDGQTDYLAMLSSPSFEVLPSPNYVNESFIQEYPDDEKSDKNIDESYL